MSLTHTIFSLPAAEQDAAIRLLARKNLQETGGGGLRAGFDGTIRRILHAKHAAGASREDLATLRRHCRQLFHEVRGGAA